ncbi:TetR/AcrR family transcriptional regulator [Paenibacillus sp.]|jgi:AcrR family transcriptional regulator|uniref:TetR/AcrR family transcriptional regulator n=1 Tax=Paenibacillus sp. TaxID=58172 RepID=UPI002838979F|nr:TetR/AcrR family transcriptional regulator [Paenibacillus sp.]MDR0269312.1 TetR/AcrR family transcriptional regulator [Paenibacillus sp.]
MNAKRSLLDTALTHFSQEGYEGTSLQKIAEDVGIKKPSIYCHFKGKDDLFLSSLKNALKEEKRRITRYFISRRELPLEKRLSELLGFLQEEYTRSSESKFVLRMSFFPPSALYDEVMELILPFLDSMERRVVQLMEQAKAEGSISICDPENAAIAYMTLTDGILAEMVYGGVAGSKRRMKASWPIFWAGIQVTET